MKEKRGVFLQGRERIATQRRVYVAFRNKRIDNVNTFIYPELMDQRYELNGISFVWDANKALSNLSKHRVSFEQAVEAFFDPFLRVVDASASDESRDAVIGMDEQWNLLFVVHLEIEGDQFRIISARHTTAKERQIYEG